MLLTCCRSLRCSCIANQPLPSSRVSRVLNLTGAPLPDQSPGTGLGSVEAMTCMQKRFENEICHCNDLYAWQGQFSSCCSWMLGVKKSAPVQ